MPWAIWRLVLKKIATLHEIETHYSYLDVILANEALDIEEEIEYQQNKNDNKDFK